jgi:hypothetical protein
MLEKAVIMGGEVCCLAVFRHPDGPEESPGLMATTIASPSDVQPSPPNYVCRWLKEECSVIIQIDNGGGKSSLDGFAH